MIRVSVLITGVAGTGLAFGNDSVLAFWVVSGDLIYCIIFPQLVCVLHIPFANTYGAVIGYVLSFLLRGLSGEPGLGIPPVILFPGWREENGVIRQYFPFRTLTMLSSIITITTVSRLVNLIFCRQLIPRSWDFLRAFEEKKHTEEEEEEHEPCNEMNCTLNTKF